jgi:hypothetical protein
MNIENRIIRLDKSKKSWKIPKGLSESVEQKTQWSKGKYKRTNNDLQNIHIIEYAMRFERVTFLLDI